ncbi:MAG: tetratricopeptide repeat protein [Algicola sp.]|nr:tetratricopeptide repeat protein [Algicola sp.]
MAKSKKKRVTKKKPQTGKLMIAAEKQRDLAHQLHDQQKWQKAQSAYAKAITTFTKLATNSQGKDDLATILYDAGALFTDTGQFEHAGNAFGESAKIFAELTVLDPDKHAANLAASLCNQGSVFNQTHQYEPAVPVLEKAAEIQRMLHTGERRNIKAELASTLRNLASALQGVGELDRAQGIYDEMFVIDRQLAKDNPEDYTRQLSQSLCNYSSLLSEKHQLDEALASSDEALSVLRDATLVTGPGHPIDEAMIYTIRGKILKTQVNFVDALSAFTHAIAIVHMLIENQQLQYMHKLAKLYGEAGEIQQELGELDDALRSFQASKAVIATLGKQDALKYVGDLVDVNQQLAEVYRDKQDETQAKEHYNQAIALLEPFNAIDDPDHTMDTIIQAIKDNRDFVQ